MKEPITIVVPVYNRPQLIVRCLDSLHAQTWRPLRVMVVDNASTDETPEAVESWIRTHSGNGFNATCVHESRKGAAYARQKGLESVMTDKVMFFDSDDTLRPEAVETVMDLWRKEPGADLVTWPVLIHHSSNPQLTHSPSGNLIERHLVHAVLRTQGYAVKKDFFLKAGGWRGEFPCWNDFETGTRLLLHSPETITIHTPLVDVYPQEESITGLDFSSKAGLWEKSLDAIEVSIRESIRPDKRRLLNIVSYRRAILAAHYSKEGHAELALPLYRRCAKEVNPLKRPLIRFAYEWTRRGLRGAFLIVGRFL